MKCSDCGGEISIWAGECVHCGAPRESLFSALVDAYLDYRDFRAAAVAIGAAIVLSIFFLYDKVESSSLGQAIRSFAHDVLNF